MYVYYVNKNRSHTVLIKNIFFASSKIDTLLRNGPDKNDSNNGNEHVGIQEKVPTFLLSVLTSDWLKQQKLTKLHKAVHIFILTFQPSSI